MSRRLPVLLALLLWLPAACVFAASARSDPATATAVQQRTHAGIVTEIGRLGGVPYRIDLPQDWNHRLVVFYHGFSLDPVRYALDAPQPWLTPVLAHGYAVIQSAYAQTGWALPSAVADSAQLRAYFIARHGEPQQSLVLGASMGGALVAMALEDDPAQYQGGLALCGALAPSWQLGQRQFRMLAAFAYYFPGILPPLAAVPADYSPDAAIEQRIAAAFAAHPQRFADLHAIWHVGTPADMPGVIAFATALVQRVQQQAGGNPFGNADYVYLGTADDAALNAGVTRYRADPAAVAFLLRNYTPSGRLLRPLLELHDLADPLVPADSVAAYADAVQRAGHAQNFVQQYVPAAGHCVFSSAQVGHAFDELLRWVDHGQAPSPGALPQAL